MIAERNDRNLVVVPLSCGHRSALWLGRPCDPLGRDPVAVGVRHVGVCSAFRSAFAINTRAIETG